MATATATAQNSRDDFAAMLDETFGGPNGLNEGSVVKGIIVAIEKDMAIIDVAIGAARVAHDAGSVRGLE